MSMSVDSKKLGKSLRLDAPHVRRSGGVIEVRVPPQKGWLVPARELIAQDLAQGMTESQLVALLRTQHGDPRPNVWYPVTFSKAPPPTERGPHVRSVLIQQGEGWFALARRVAGPKDNVTQVACRLAGVSTGAALTATPFPWAAGSTIRVDSSFRVVDLSDVLLDSTPPQKASKATPRLDGGGVQESWPVLSRFGPSTSHQSWRFAQTALEGIFAKASDANVRRALMSSVEAYAQTHQLSAEHAISLIDRHDLTPAQKARVWLATNPYCPNPLGKASLDRLGRSNAPLTLGLVDATLNQIAGLKGPTIRLQTGITGERNHGTIVADLFTRGMGASTTLVCGEVTSYESVRERLSALLTHRPKPEVVALSINLAEDSTSNDGQAIRALLESHPDVCFVVAAGNEGKRNVEGAADDTTGNFDFSQIPNVFLLGAVQYDPNYKTPVLLETSNRGEGVDFAYWGRAIPAIDGTGNVEMMMDGTSWCAPQVGNVVAQMRMIDPSLTVSEIRRILNATSVGRPSGIESGVVDPVGALLAAEVSARIKQSADAPRVLAEVAEAEGIPVNGPLMQRIKVGLGLHL